jgi:hypothetical protein
MIVGPGRIKIPRSNSPGGGSSSEGLVVQAVLVMALVSTIGVLIFAVRVAGSRQASASATMSQAARQAAEYGYAEIVAEMNRDEKSYLWVVNSNNWGNVSIQDLKDCGVASSADPGSNPISALTANQTLSRSPELSYRLTDYQAPINLTPLPTSVPTVCSTKFANLMGGTGVITIVGTANRGSGFISTYTLKRTLTVNRAAPIFNNPITAPPLNRIFDAADNRFPDFPTSPPGGASYALTCQPQVDAASVASTSIIECTAEPSSGPPLTQNFKSATATNVTAPGLDHFPFVVGQAEPWTPCSKVEVVPGDERVRCLFTSIRVRANPADTTIKSDMLVRTDTFPVEFFLINDMIIDPGSRLSGYRDYSITGDGKGWSRFRIFGVNSGTSCGSQTITIDPIMITPAETPPTYETNLQNSFLWLKKGKLKYQTSTALESIPALVGSVCQFESSVNAPAYLSTLSNRSFMDGLGGAYGGLGDPPLFRGVFGGAVPIRFYYRGFGFNEQRLSP